MATILFTYEFGAGLGHLNRLLAVATRLEGHRLVFALPDMALGRAIVERKLGAQAEIRPAVAWPAPTDPEARKVPTQTFADVIRLFGFHDVERLAGRVQAWRAILQEVRPDLIVADFAPTLRLASQGTAPTIVVGNGYTVPPRGRVLPPMRPWESTVPARSRKHEGELIASVNAVRAGLGGAAIDHFADLFHGEASFVCTLNEFDPYRSAREDAPLWPFNVPVIPEQEVERDRVFAYFQAGHPALGSVLGALTQLGRRAEIYVQGADPKAIAARCPRHVGVHTKPADFAAILPRANLLLHHAGLGTAYAGLVAGVPQVVLPLNLEHAITTSGLEAFGSTLRVPVTPAPGADQIKAALAQVLNGGPERLAAAAAQADLSARRDPASIEQVLAACTAQL